MDAPRTLQQAILFFSDYENCHKAVVAIRWPDGVVKCPRCGSDTCHVPGTPASGSATRKHPLAKFSLKVGTVFEDSPLPLQKWLPALWLLTNCKNGISSYELARALGVTQKTAWFMLSASAAGLAGQGRRQARRRSRSRRNLHRRQGAQHAHREARANRHDSRAARWPARLPSWACWNVTARTASSQSACRSSRTASKRRHLKPVIGEHVEAARPSTPMRCRLVSGPEHATTSTTSSTTPKRTSTGKFTPTAARTSGSC